MERVAIFGVGLIGGSFALALRRAGFKGEIAGVSSAQTISTAIDLGVIDRGMDAAVAACEADFIYLAQPVLSIIETLRQHGASFRPGALITDAGSTKGRIVDAARGSVTAGMFVGGHPMAGKESRGVQEADAALFEGRTYVVTPLSRSQSNEPRFHLLLDWVRRIGANPVIINPDDHDRLVAYTSHVPQLLSTALASVLSEVDDAQKVAGPAVLELTRLGASPFQVWHDILVTNRVNIEQALADVVARLNQFRGSIGTDSLAGEFLRAADGAKKLRSNLK